MEAYSIACINQILNPYNDLLVIKAISDKGINKVETENSGERDAAKRNAADFTLRLIKYLEENNIGNAKSVELKIHPKESVEASANFKLKIKFSITNIASFPITIESISFIFDKTNLLDPISG
jgi:hypothetical protein